MAALENYIAIGFESVFLKLGNNTPKTNELRTIVVVGLVMLKSRLPLLQLKLALVTVTFRSSFHLKGTIFIVLWPKGIFYHF